jgi:radical SAM protein with 4Fe4S-binding SPASM domain
MKEIVWNHVIKAISFKRITNALKVLTSLGLSSITKESYSWGVPFIVTVEPTVLCNLRCPQCITGMGKVDRKQSTLNLDLFKNIIIQIGDRIWYLLLFNQGEPFLNPDLVEFIEIAKQKRIYVTTSTNGHFLIDEVTVQKLVKSGLDSIIISLDGIDAESYSKYRQGGDFREVIKGIENMVKIRDQLNSKTPKVLVQCLLMKHNEDHLAEMRKLAADLKVDRLLLKTFQIESWGSAKDFLSDDPKWCRYRSNGKTIKIKNSLKERCLRLWYSTVILSDGRIVPCCFDKNGEYSFDIITSISRIEKIWKSDAYNKFRNRVLQRQESIPICHNCTQNQKVYL